MASACGADQEEGAEMLRRRRPERRVILSVRLVVVAAFLLGALLPALAAPGPRAVEAQEATADQEVPEAPAQLPAESAPEEPAAAPGTPSR